MYWIDDDDDAAVAVVVGVVSLNCAPCVVLGVSILSREKSLSFLVKPEKSLSFSPSSEMLADEIGVTSSSLSFDMLITFLRLRVPDVDSREPIHRDSTLS